MAEYIERETALEAAKKSHLYFTIKPIIKSIPAADVRPVVRGKWVEMYDDDEYARKYWLCCSICGCVAPFGRMSDEELHTNFCPHCGADMRRGHNG